MRNDLSLRSERLSQAPPNTVIDEHIRLARRSPKLLVRRPELSSKLHLCCFTPEVGISLGIDLLILLGIQFLVKFFHRLRNR